MTNTTTSMTLEILDLSASGFATVLGQVGDDDWGRPTGNEGQSVRQLVDHVIGGNRMATAILAGGTREDGLAAFARSADDVDLRAAFEESRREQAEAFAAPGALERMVAHPAMTMPGLQLLGFRTTEHALHGWDLARAIGVDDTIDPSVLEALDQLLTAMGPMIVASGMFGSGASGTLPADASLQDRVLDASGRRPG
jgi:uncharacterized protein (TIGR03086 family)